MSDYDRVAEAIAFIAAHAERQPSLQAIAAHLHMSPFHCQRLFCRWAGVTPKRFLQVLTVERAKPLLRAARPVLDVSGAVGLGSGSRLYDHFVRVEAVTPGEYKSGGAGLVVAYGEHATPFGEVFVATTRRGVCTLAFTDAAPSDHHLRALRERWPAAVLRREQHGTRPISEALFGAPPDPERPLSLYVSGTNFQISVWKALLRIPPGTLASYAQVAAAIGHPRAARAVGSAIGANPVAFLIPCHRVIRGAGGLGGYRWGETRKRAIQVWEAVRRGAT